MDFFGPFFGGLFLGGDKSTQKSTAKFNQNFQGCENGVFGKRCFRPLPKTGGFDKK